MDFKIFMADTRILTDVVYQRHLVIISLAFYIRFQHFINFISILQNVAILDVCDTNKISESLQNTYQTQTVVFIQTDVSKKDQVKRAFDEIVRLFGYIDYVVGNAGILCESDYERTINVNLVSEIFAPIQKAGVRQTHDTGIIGIYCGVKQAKWPQFDTKAKMKMMKCVKYTQRRPYLQTQYIPMVR